MTPNLQTELFGWTLRSPLALASGVVGLSQQEMTAAATQGAGLITAKSCSLTPRAGHIAPNNVVWDTGMINAIGLTNPGVHEYVTLLQATKATLTDTPLMASIFGATVAEYGEAAAIVKQAAPDMLEVNISCPNVEDEFGTPFAADMAMTAAVTETVKQQVDCPVIIKLAPNVPNIARIAAAAVEAGADGINAINTVPGMIVDLPSGQPRLSNRVGGLSGAAIKPIALRAVYEIRRVVNVPIIGTGGVTTGADVAEMLMVGATVVGIGAAVWREGTVAIGRIHREFDLFMRHHTLESVAEMRGRSQHG